MESDKMNQRLNSYKNMKKISLFFIVLAMVFCAAVIKAQTETGVQNFSNPPVTGGKEELFRLVKAVRYLPAKGVIRLQAGSIPICLTRQTRCIRQGLITKGSLMASSR